MTLASWQYIDYSVNTDSVDFVELETKPLKIKNGSSCVG